MLLKAEKISFRYPSGPEILDQINFQVESGEVIGLTAKSGRGKTTFAKILAGYETASSGSILLDGNSIPKSGYHPVQLIFQHPEKAVNPRWKMSQVVQEAGGACEEMQKRMGIQKEWLGRWPIELSGGELQRFCVLRVLNERTKFIIADEMTTMLDAITQAQIWKVVLQYAKEHQIGVVVISHERELLNRICDRIVEL